MSQTSPLPLRREENWNPTSPNFFLAKDKKIAYLQIPKAACSTFMSMMLRLENPRRYEKMAPRLRKTVFDLHRDPELLSRRNRAPGYLRFTFVRHPLRRIESFYHKQIATESVDRMKPAHLADLCRNLANSDLEPRLEFPAFIDRLIESPKAISNIHVRRQVDFLYGENGPRFDFVGRLEELKHHENFLGTLFGMKELSLPVLNPSDRRRPSLSFTAKQMKFFRNFYAADMQLLGYMD